MDILSTLPLSLSEKRDVSMDIEIYGVGGVNEDRFLLCCLVDKAMKTVPA